MNAKDDLALLEAEAAQLSRQIQGAMEKLEELQGHPGVAVQRVELIALFNRLIEMRATLQAERMKRTAAAIAKQRGMSGRVTKVSA